MASTSISKAERSYIQAGLLASPPRRTDGRGLTDFRPISLETGVAPLANGSARLSIGQNLNDGSGGTEVLAAAKLEVENVEGEGVDGGRIVCSVSCSPSAYPNHSTGALDDLQYDLTTVLNQTLSDRSLHPSNLVILPGKKSWLLNLDIVVLADSGNIYDALFMAARAALWDTKVPRTRSVEYKAKKNEPVAKNTSGGSGDMDVDQDTTSGFDTRRIISNAIDFELPDYWDEGEVLDGRDHWPVCVTLNLVPPVHFLDALPLEEASTSLRLLLVFSFPTSAPPVLQATRMLGAGELNVAELKVLLAEGEKYAKEMMAAITFKLKEEDIRRNQKAREKFAKR